MRESERIQHSVTTIATPIVRSLDLELVDVECTGQGSRTLVRVFIDKQNGVTVSDCEQVHLSLSHALDVQDPIPHTYTLEVSSPGLDRPLKRRQDYARSIGKLVRLKLTNALDGQWRLTGRLQTVNEEGVVLEMEEGRTTELRHLARNTIGEARLEVEF